MKQRIVISIILMHLFFLSGCNRTSSPNKKLLAQQESTLADQKRGEKLVRSITMYEQFELIGKFAALWLTEHMVMGQKKQSPSDSISFYVLSLEDVHFNGPSAEWHIALKINDACFQPTIVKPVSISKIYQSFFGPSFSHYKFAYLVTFKATDEKNTLLLQPNSSMKLEISFEDRQGHMVWNFNERSVLLPHFESHSRKGN